MKIDNFLKQRENLAANNDVQKQTQQLKQTAFPEATKQTEICESFERRGHCYFGQKCIFAHQRDQVQRPKEHLETGINGPQSCATQSQLYCYSNHSESKCQRSTKRSKLQHSSSQININGAQTFSCSQPQPLDDSKPNMPNCFPRIASRASQASQSEHADNTTKETVSDDKITFQEQNPLILKVKARLSDGFFKFNSYRFNALEAKFESIQSKLKEERNERYKTLEKIHKLQEDRLKFNKDAFSALEEKFKSAKSSSSTSLSNSAILAENKQKIDAISKAKEMSQKMNTNFNTNKHDFFDQAAILQEKAKQLSGDPALNLRSLSSKVPIDRNSTLAQRIQKHPNKDLNTNKGEFFERAANLQEKAKYFSKIETQIQEKAKLLSSRELVGVSSLNASEFPIDNCSSAAKSNPAPSSKCQGPMPTKMRDTDKIGSNLVASVTLTRSSQPVTLVSSSPTAQKVHKKALEQPDPVPNGSSPLATAAERPFQPPILPSEPHMQHTTQKSLMPTTHHFKNTKNQTIAVAGQCVNMQSVLNTPLMVPAVTQPLVRPMTFFLKPVSLRPVQGRDPLVSIPVPLHMQMPNPGTMINSPGGGVVAPNQQSQSVMDTGDFAIKPGSLTTMEEQIAYNQKMLALEQQQRGKSSQQPLSSGGGIAGNFR